ncbi:Pfkfb2 [Symbiodinium pilosum]|uniref:Pfkfb2 protein n=1 Tax=Symbiodinium pilosum TaxID=2952 RepID=A0A812WIK2_SYMPI|nr:Pfkfb2 [Symbiodinium pilosum]
MGPDGDERLYEALNRFFDVTNSPTADPYDFDQTGVEGSGGFAIILSSDTVESTKSMWSAHTKWHRKWMARKLEDEMQAEVCFIQISVDSSKGEKYLADLAAYRGMTLEESRDLIADYQDHYVPIQMDASEDETPFIHLMNYNQKMVVNKMMRSFVGSQVCHFLSNLHPFQHTVYLARHGESDFNVEKRIGGNSGLSRRGEEFARRTAEFVKYVVCGHASDLVCVTLTAQDVPRLRSKIIDLKRNIVASEDWTDLGDASGGAVRRFMQLKRLQVGWGADFKDSPDNVKDLLRILEGAKVVTLVFVGGDASGAGTVPGRLWTSSLRRTIETAQFIEHPILPAGADGKPFYQMRGRQFRNMDEVYAGEYDGFTEEAGV